MSPRLRILPRSFCRRPAPEVARDLLGRCLVRRFGGRRLVLRIVETEAYLGAPDRASHAWNGRHTARTAFLFRDGGHAYVYFVYGLHHLFNVVTGSREDASAVLVRAGEPLEGEAVMRDLRDLGLAVRAGQVAGGPARLCQALAIDLAHNGVLLDRGDLTLAEGPPAAAAEIASAPRVGVGYAGDHAAWPLRFALKGNPHVSPPRL